MITLGITGLISAYLLLAILLLSLNLYSNWSWRVKAGVIVLTSFFYIVSYFSFPPLMGWPTEGKLPERFGLVAAYIQEPIKSTGSKGNIYLWITDMEHGPGLEEPRAYRLPFSGDLHAKVVEAQKKLRKGTSQLGEAEELEDMSGNVPLDLSQKGQESLKIDFYDLPDPLFPEK